MKSRAHCNPIVNSRGAAIGGPMIAAVELVAWLRPAALARFDPAEKARIGRICSALLTWAVVILVPVGHDAEKHHAAWHPLQHVGEILRAHKRRRHRDVVVGADEVGHDPAGKIDKAGATLAMAMRSASLRPPHLNAFFRPLGIVSY